MQSARVGLIVASFVNVAVGMIALCSEFRSFQRVFAWVFVPYLVYFLFRVVSLYTTPATKFVPFRLGGPVNHDVRRTSVLIGGVYVVWVLAYAFLGLFPLACDSNVLPYCWFFTPVDRSSCFGNAGVSSVVYSAVGALTGQQTFRSANMICVITDARFADGNGLSIKTYPNVPGSTLPDYDAAPCPTASPCLCSSRAQDFPNPALGIGGGCFVGSNQTSTIVLCPGNVVDDANVVGLRVCPACLSTFEARGFSDSGYAHCSRTPIQNGYWCDTMCPQIGELLDKRNNLVTFAVVLALGLEPLIAWGAEELVLVHLV